MYIAHINKDSDKQSIKEHSVNTAELCKEYAIPPFKNFMYTVGLMHDIGKFQQSFQRRILGNKPIKVEHSICGAKEIPKILHFKKCSILAQLCIAGHHSGIPDVGCRKDTQENSTLEGRLKRKTEDYSMYKSELKVELNNQISEQEQKDICDFLCKDYKPTDENLINKFAFFVRYCFSCLTDADSIDTAEFFGDKVNAPLTADFVKCLEKTNKKLHSFKCKTKLQKARTSIQNQVFEKVDKDSEIYLINMPTGSGKTLCSIKFALERAIKKKKKRIIYVIPYNSIINQVAEEFESLLGESAQILRHQSTFDYDDPDNNKNNDENYRKACEFAIENWDSQFIITTAVQFFESIYKNTRKKLRKLHNMSDSILIFDETHLMPTEYLKPCLDAICYITKYLNSEAVFLTATMPDYHKLIRSYSLKNSQILNLVNETSEFEVFKKCNFRYIGEIGFENLIKQTEGCPSSLIVVNTKSSAEKIFELCPSGNKKYHLSTYMTSRDRENTIKKIKDELNKLEKDFPNLENVPENRKIIVVSTSLIEAGVDLDFYKVFREFNGLDHILQAGGRCNREGKRKMAEVDIFKLEGRLYNTDHRFPITSSIVEKYEDISCEKSIGYYYEQLYYIKSNEIQSKSLHKFCSDPYKIRLKEYAKKFNLIEDVTISIIIDQDEESQKLINELKNTKKTNMRKLQKYACIVYGKEFNELQKQGAVDDYGTGVWCLTNEDYYDSETGIKT